MQRQVSRLCYQVCTCMFYRTKNSGGWGGGYQKHYNTHKCLKFKNMWNWGISPS